MEDIFREKHAGVYVYFSSDSSVYAKQRLRGYEKTIFPEE
jgi:hypothetical protein